MADEFRRLLDRKTGKGGVKCRYCNSYKGGGRKALQRMARRSMADDINRAIRIDSVCSGPPEEDEYCSMCGEHVENCICPHCDICGEQGDPYCYEMHFMAETKEQADNRARIEKEREEEAMAENEYWNKLYREEEQEREARMIDAQWATWAGQDIYPGL